MTPLKRQQSNFNDINNELKRYFYCFNLSEMFKNIFFSIKSNEFVVVLLQWQNMYNFSV